MPELNLRLPRFRFGCMSGGLVLLTGLLTGGAAIAADQAPLADAAWAGISGPTEEAVQVFGRHTHGCIAGAKALPPEGPGYVTIRTRRNRFWGHPVLLDFVTNLGRQARDQKIATLMIGDLGQPRGGPISGHGSHETGLDVDIWLKLQPLDPKPVAAAFQEPQEISVVPDKRKPGLDPAVWKPEMGRIIRLAASSPGVDRIFINPAIKQHLCDLHAAQKENEPWLRKLRPWYNHTGHMHIRMSCPKDSPECRQQSNLPPGNGCNASLAWWFTDGPWAPKKPVPAGKTAKPKPLPESCNDVFAKQDKKKADISAPVSSGS